VVILDYLSWPYNPMTSVLIRDEREDGCKGGHVMKKAEIGVKRPLGQEHLESPELRD
jgi:hypothetical protein